MTTQQGFPQIGAPLVEPSTGQLNQIWYQFFVSLFMRTGGASGNAGDTIIPLTVDSSPFIYKAAITGNIWINPGTYCDVSVKRGTTTLEFGKVTRGIFPLAENDTIIVTFTTLSPTIYFI